jgi:hypothetical protein
LTYWLNGTIPAIRFNTRCAVSWVYPVEYSTHHFAADTLSSLDIFAKHRTESFIRVSETRYLGAKYQVEQRPKDYVHRLVKKKKNVP